MADAKVAVAPVVQAAGSVAVAPTVALDARRAADEAAARRMAVVEQREQALRQRERELAEQRRVLAEEYRLLHTQRAGAATPPPTSTMRVTVPSRPVPARFASARPESFWSWLKRLMLGASRPAVEEN